MDTEQPPIAFISHATEDKARFVIPFATSLRASGVDAWVDQWEITAGDSLVDKIFEEGLKRAAVIIVVLSHVSVTKKWVREELDAGVVARITRGTTLIPLRIDPVEVPEALKHTVWVDVEDIANFDPALQKVLAAVFRTSAKPPLGPAPAYARIDALPGLNKQDSTVLRLFCEAAMAKDSPLGLQTHEVAAVAKDMGIEAEQFLESAQILAEARQLERSKVLAAVSPYYNVTPTGLEKYAQAMLPAYGELVRSVISIVTNSAQTSSREIASALKIEKFLLIENVLTMLERRGLLKIAKVSGRQWHVHSISPRLKRILQDGA